MNSEMGPQDLAGRIALLVGDGSVNSIALKCGISESLLRKYLSGSIPGADKLVMIADATGVSVEWLATGRGEMRRDAAQASLTPPDAIDSRLLALVHKSVAEAYKAENIKIYADPLADEVARIYADLVAAYDSPEERQIGLKGMIQQLRRQMRSLSASGANTKQVS